MNTLDLDQEWGAIDLIEEVEQEFDIKISTEEAELCATVGDLYALICAHVPAWDDQCGKCASSMTFFRIRRALDPDRTRRITPRTPLSKNIQPLKLFRELSQETGLRLPTPHLTWIGMCGGMTFVLSLIVAIIALFAGLWIVGGAALATGALGLSIVRMDRGLLPSGITTVGDLVRRSAPLNSRALHNEGGKPSDRWSILVSLSAEYGRLAPNEIAPETFFHRKSLELAKSATAA